MGITMMRISKVLIAGFFLFVLALWTMPALAQEDKGADQQSNTIFILDASGSMWGQIDGTPKITIAKDVMKKLVSELPDNTPIGLIAYGHRRKGDCSDVQTLVTLGKSNKAAVLAAVGKLNALGKTPLSRSVDQAISILRKEGSAATIILVSDGIESCNADPCATVKAAKAAGIDFVMHTVGFGLSKDESAQLQCMADAGGGQYQQANSADELLKATRQALHTNGTLGITVKVNGKKNNFLYRIEDKATGKVLYNNTLPSPSGFKIKLAEGQYRAFIRPGGVSGAPEKMLDDIVIKSGEAIEREVAFNAGTLDLTVTVGGKPAHALVHVENPQTHKWIYESSVFGTDTPVSISLFEGPVDIEVQVDGNSRRAEGVMINGGQTTSKTIAITKAGEANKDGLEFNTDRPYGDYTHIILPSADPLLCQRACQADQACRAWTYNATQASEPYCWLKNTVPEARSDTCCVSGVK